MKAVSQEPYAWALKGSQERESHSYWFSFAIYSFLTIYLKFFFYPQFDLHYHNVFIAYYIFPNRKKFLFNKHILSSTYMIGADILRKCRRKKIIISLHHVSYHSLCTGSFLGAGEGDRVSEVISYNPAFFGCRNYSSEMLCNLIKVLWLIHFTTRI